MTTDNQPGMQATEAAASPRPHEVAAGYRDKDYSNSLDDATIDRIAHVLRAIFPHDALGDGPYRRSAEAIGAAARESNRTLGVLIEGVRSLDALVDGNFADLDVDEASGVLRHIEQTEFFQLLLTNAVVTLYSDQETWDLLGYEGASFQEGGYINRGFDDLHWLPEPRIEEYDGNDQLIGYVPVAAGLNISFDQTKKVATI